MDRYKVHHMEEKESLSALARWWKEVAGQISAKTLMAIIFIFLGYVSRISYDILDGKKVSLVTSIAIAAISLSVGSLMLAVCLYNNFGIATYILPFVLAFLAEKAMKFVLINFEKILTQRFVLLWSKFKIIFTFLMKNDTGTKD